MKLIYNTRIKGFLFTALLIFVCLKIVAQDNLISKSINTRFSSDQEIYFFDNDIKIFNLEFSGEITFENPGSVVRLILIDINKVEYLIYESYPLIAEKQNFIVNSESIETNILDGIIPVSIRTEILDASLNIYSIQYSLSPIDKSKTTSFEEKVNKRINKINENIKKQGLNWVAGITSVSNLKYSEKKLLFPGEKLPSLQGFEYYKEGVFNLWTKSIYKEEATKSTTLVTSFDWRYRHGANNRRSSYYDGDGVAGWMTVVKDQGSCGSCGVFAVTGTLEGLVNLFYNRHYDLDLSEQNAVSCVTGECSPGWLPADVIDYYTSVGVVPEDCFPYEGDSEIECEEICNDPDDQITIEGRVNFPNSEYPQNPYALKKMLIRYGPLSSGISNLNHAMALVGYELDPSDSQTIWIFKNSWGLNYGENGYMKIKTSIYNIAWTHALLVPINSLVYSESDIRCRDVDCDGFYNWGIGNKPSHCPSCPSQPDGNDFDYNLGPLDADGNGNCLPIEISGGWLVCTANKTYNFINRASGKSITWSKSDNLTEVSGQSTDQYVVKAYSSSSSGPGWVRATLSSTGCNNIVYQKDVWVGKFESTAVTGQAGVCPNSIYTYTAQVPGGHSSSYSYSWTYPSNWMYPYQYQNTMRLQTPSSPYYGTVRVSVTNACGTSGYSGITVYPGYGCGGYFSIYPNPASNEVTISINETVTEVTQDTDISDLSVIKTGFDDQGPYTIHIYSSLGTLVSTAVKSGMSFSVPLNNLLDGTYIIEVTDGKNSYREQLIVKHD
jgi:hypothetical protein